MQKNLLNWHLLHCFINYNYSCYQCHEFSYISTFFAEQTGLLCGTDSNQNDPQSSSHQSIYMDQNNYLECIFGKYLIVCTHRGFYTNKLRHFASKLRNRWSRVSTYTYIYIYIFLFFFGENFRTPLNRLTTSFSFDKFKLSLLLSSIHFYLSLRICLVIIACSQCVQFAYTR